MYHILETELENVSYAAYLGAEIDDKLCPLVVTCGFPKYQGNSIQNTGQTKPGLYLYNVRSLRPKNKQGL